LGRAPLERAELHRREEVILQVLADAGKVVDDGDAGGLQVVGGADAGKEENVGGADRAGGEDDLFARGRRLLLSAGAVAHALDAAALDDETGDGGAGHDLEIRPRGGGVEERVGGAPAAAVAHGVLVMAGALLLGAVEIVVARDAAALERGGDGGLGDGRARTRILHVEGAARAVVWGRRPVP